MGHSGSTEILRELLEVHPLLRERLSSHYHPIIASFGQRLGLSESDAQQVALECLSSFLASWREGRFVRDRGRLRQWLLNMAHKRIQVLQQHDHGAGQGTACDGPGILDPASVDESAVHARTIEPRHCELRKCLEKVRYEFHEDVFRAFELVSLRGWTAQHAAEALGIDVNAILEANRRVLTRVRGNREAGEARQ